MQDLVPSFRNLFEFLINIVAGSNFTLNAIWLAGGFAILLSLKSLRLLFGSSSAGVPENFRGMAESMASASARMEPRRVIVVCCTETVQVDNVLYDLLRGSDWFPILGTDCEMKQRPRKPPKILMMQFANRFGDCVLVRFPIRVCEFSSVFLNIITDPYIWKVGVGVYDDVQNLAKNHPQHDIIPQGSFDLRFLAEEAGMKQRGLKKMAKTLLNIEMYDERQDRGGWDSAELTAAQIRYAAMDALVGVRLFEKFFELSLTKVDATIEITEDIKKQEISNFLHKWFDKKSQQYRENNGVADSLVYFGNWLYRLILRRP